MQGVQRANAASLESHKNKGRRVPGVSNRAAHAVLRAGCMLALEPKKLVLVVDDDVRTAQLLARLLRQDGYDVEVAGDGACALGRLSRPPWPDILVTDLQMPHADGLAVAQYARSRRPGMPVFIITSYPYQMSQRHELLDPRARVLTKPISYEAFANELRQAVEQISPAA